MPFGSKKTKSAEKPAIAPPKKPVKANEVFTPSVPAGRGFVGRELEMKDLRKKGLRVPGTQVVVWGESGAGKSSLVNKVLVDEGHTAVKTACTPDSTYEQILAAAFAGTGAFYITESAEHTDVTVSVGTVLGSELIGAKTSASAELDVGKGVTREPIARPQLSPQRLVAELGSRDYSWVIEDIHKVEESERLKIAHALKVFADEGAKYPLTRVIVLGVSESVDELVVESTNVGKRLIDIPVPPLGHDELGKILDVGEQLLNLDFSAIRTRLLSTAVGTASITHALALACCDERDVYESGTDRVLFTEQDFEEAVQGYARTRSSTLKARFGSALKVHRKRTYDNTKIILRALTQLPESGGTVGEILAVIRREPAHSKYPSGNAAKYLQELQEDRRGSLIRKSSTGVYRFDEPLQHAYAKSFFGLTSATSGSEQPAKSSDWETLFTTTIYAKTVHLLQSELAASLESMAIDPREQWQDSEDEGRDVS